MAWRQRVGVVVNFGAPLLLLGLILAASAVRTAIARRSEARRVF